MKIVSHALAISSCLLINCCILISFTASKFSAYFPFDYNPRENYVHFVPEPTDSLHDKYKDVMLYGAYKQPHQM